MLAANVEVQNSPLVHWLSLANRPVFASRLAFARRIAWLRFVAELLSGRQQGEPESKYGQLEAAVGRKQNQVVTRQTGNCAGYRRHKHRPE
jgi:hypothetical protein